MVVLICGAKNSPDTPTVPRTKTPIAPKLAANIPPMNMLNEWTSVNNPHTL